MRDCNPKMPIHFSCVKCAKKLFAQEHFSGRTVTCPACGANNVIPAPALAPAPVDSSESEVTPPGVPTAKSADARPVPVPPGPGDPPLKPCPVCAEKIQPAAKKCRFCGAYLDPVLEREERARELLFTQKTIDDSTGIWRIIARVATLFTIAWLILMLLAILQQKDGSVFAALFDGLLIAGLMLSMKQMQHGPWHVFLVAALAVALALLSQLGYTIVTGEVYRSMQEQKRPDTPDLSAAQWEQIMWMMMSIAGLIVSIPIWITAAKVAAAQRLKSAKK
jgi:hypothetical protein